MMLCDVYHRAMSQQLSLVWLREKVEKSVWFLNFSLNLQAKSAITLKINFLDLHLLTMAREISPFKDWATKCTQGVCILNQVNIKKKQKKHITSIMQQKFNYKTEKKKSKKRKKNGRNL